MGKHKGNTSKELRGVLRKWSGQQLRCLYTNACSVGNRQKQLEVTTLLENCDLVAITEIWWDKSHNLSLLINGYGLSEEKREEEGWRGCSLNQEAY